MDNKDVLRNAIRKAIEGGWKAPSLLLAMYANGVDDIEGQHVEMIRGMITSHDFAKALWQPIPIFELLCSKCESEYNWWDSQDTKKYGFPPSKFCNSDGTKLKKVIKSYSHPWMYHLKNMVIADDPIKYLSDNI